MSTRDENYWRTVSAVVIGIVVFEGTQLLGKIIYYFITGIAL